MTTTRKYYEALIDLFEKLCSTQAREPKTFLDVKTDLHNLIQRILKFKLFPLTFSEEFFKDLNKEIIDDFTIEKLTLVANIDYELHECLSASRLRYGGELLYYAQKLDLAFLTISSEEYKTYVSITNTPRRIWSKEKVALEVPEQKAAYIKQLKQAIKKSKPKTKTKIKKEDYAKIEIDLQQKISDYRSYVFENYPSIATKFNYYQKKVRAYITQASASDIHEFRVCSFDPKDGDISVRLEYSYYDFCPTYGFNLEEITDPSNSYLIFGIEKKDYSFRNYFADADIHRELVEIFLHNASEKSLVDFATFLLKCDGYNILPQNHRTSLIDICAWKDEQKYEFEVFHRQARSLTVINEILRKYEKIERDTRINFIFSSYPGEEIARALEAKGIRCFTYSDMVRRFFALNNSEVIHWYLRSQLQNIVISDQSEEKRHAGKVLIDRIKKCPTGEESWSTYETIGVDVFKFLFADNFNPYLAEEQSENDLRNHRRDLLVNNNYCNNSSFWGDVKSRYNSTAIIIDFKNYSNKLNSTNLFSVTKYNTKHVGNFAIVFSRMGIDNTAHTEQKQLFRDGKLLLCLSDEELIQMIQEKMLNKDPIDRLETKKFELIKKG